MITMLLANFRTNSTRKQDKQSGFDDLILHVLSIYVHYTRLYVTHSKDLYLKIDKRIK